MEDTFANKDSKEKKILKFQMFSTEESCYSYSRKML